ncbi:hypothetical protein CB1_000588002 [Camelus ferus]|nr:hypothetical protein CB1_000588002 [Camelus ferus]
MLRLEEAGVPPPSTVVCCVPTRKEVVEPLDVDSGLGPSPAQAAHKKVWGLWLCPTSLFRRSASNGTAATACSTLQSPRAASVQPPQSSAQLGQPVLAPAAGLRLGLGVTRNLCAHLT